ncbi:hypothetical protein MSG28_009984 [Choristoneura fumiferana]|uniref:Uncharacterized protein n=1 Tax=Choristoneura fumiferana TaxID=7141 RepID=A0ACC0JDA7_CHOFU|nr:hypothetical protein MSG28_009984 [Choristoneura fumiferana]
MDQSKVRLALGRFSKKTAPAPVGCVGALGQMRQCLKTLLRMYAAQRGKIKFAVHCTVETRTTQLFINNTRST